MVLNLHEHKLAACIAYSLRCARRMKDSITAAHLCNALCGLVEQRAGDQKPQTISLYSALNLGVDEDEPSDFLPSSPSMCKPSLCNAIPGGTTAPRHAHMGIQTDAAGATSEAELKDLVSGRMQSTQETITRLQARIAMLESTSRAPSSSIFACGSIGVLPGQNWQKAQPDRLNPSGDGGESGGMDLDILR